MGKQRAEVKTADLLQVVSVTIGNPCVTSSLPQQDGGWYYLAFWKAVLRIHSVFEVCSFTANGEGGRGRLKSVGEVCAEAE